MKVPGLGVLTLCFVLSGATGLVYQTAWTRLFAQVFGASAPAVVAVLAAYMGGLALGAHVAGRWQHRLGRPVRAYALLELGVAASALAVAPLVGLAGRLHVLLAGGGGIPAVTSPGNALYSFASSFLILLVPTALMGATLPLLARHVVRRDSQVGRGVGLLYGANTGGAVAGTLAAAFILLPRWGLDLTVGVAAAVNLLVAGVAFQLSRHEAPAELEATASDVAARASGAAGRWILPAVFASGAVSFTHEVIWARLFAQRVGGSLQAFAVMLATFLAGLALGAGLAARWARDPQRARHGFGLTQLAAAVAGVAALAGLERLPEALGLAASGEKALLQGAGLCSAVLLPLTLAIGASFPFAVRVLATDAASAPIASARVLTWNTLGAIAGAVVAGHLALPALGFAGTLTAATVLSLALAALAGLAERPRGRRLVAASAAAGLALAVAPPATPWKTLRHSPMTGEQNAGEVVFHAVGRSTTVLLLERGIGWHLTTDGLPESTIGRAERSGRASVARWLSMLPEAVRPETRSLLVVGLGAGVTVEEVPASVEEIDVVELEEAVLHANQAVSTRRRLDPLADPRVRVHLADARSALRLTDRRFDAIVSQPSHPWTEGSANLMTREFFTLVRERLAPRGVFVQWMGLSFVDEPLLRTLAATLLEVFPWLEVYQPAAGALLLVASVEPFDIVETAPRALQVGGEGWARLGVRLPEDLVAARVLDTGGARVLARGAATNTDGRNLIRTRSARALRAPLGGAEATRLLAPLAPDLAHQPDLDPRYTLRWLVRNRSLERAAALAAALSEPAARLAGTGLVQLARGRRAAGQESLLRALALDPDCQEALVALMSFRGARLRLASRAPALSRDPLAALLDGQERRARGDTEGLRALEDRLAAVPLRHPGFAEAVRLRADWRLELGSPAEAREALALLEPLLVPPDPRDLLRYARAAAAAGDEPRALGALAEAPLLKARPLRREARRLLESLAEPSVGEWRRELLSSYR